MGLVIFNHPPVPLRLSTLHLSALGFDKTLILTWPFLRIVRGHSVIFTVCLFSVVMLVFGSVHELGYSLQCSALCGSVLVFVSAYEFCHSLQHSALCGSVMVFGSAYGFCSEVRLRLGGKLKLAAPSLASNHRPTPSIQVRIRCMLYIRILNSNARLTLHSSSVVRWSLSILRFMDLVTTGNWFRGLAGDSTAYLSGSSVSISPFSVSFGLHGICLPWVSVFR